MKGRAISQNAEFDDGSDDSGDAFTIEEDTVVTYRRRPTCLISLLLIFLMIACGRAADHSSTSTTPPPPPPAPEFSVSVASLFSPTSVSLVPGSMSVQVTVSIIGSNGFK